MSWFRKKVEVTFIDDADNRIIGKVAMLPEALPESFGLETQLRIGDSEWMVAQADPATRTEYAKKKRLILRLRRIEMMDPKNILFSLPSICDSLPPLGDIPLSGDELVLAEDDWRQVEFVSAVFECEIASGLEAIRSIRENQAVGVGWRKIELRKAPESPIAASLSSADVAVALGIDGKNLGVTYCGAHVRIENAFALVAAEGLVVYGLEPGGRVSVLALALQTATVPDDSAIALRGLAEKYGFQLVDWCRCSAAPPGDPFFGRSL
jgi:hypothetical protein